VVPEDILAHCAAWGAQESGDCRYALDLLWVAGTIAERQGATAITLAMLEEAKDEAEINSTLAMIDKFNLQLKLVVYAIALLDEAYPLGRHTSGNIYRVYRSLCLFRDTQFVTPRRLSDLLKELDYYQIVTTTIASRGRYGRTKEVVLNLEARKITAVVQPQIDANCTIRAKPFCQQALATDQRTL
jgi:cell division control protein 6